MIEKKLLLSLLLLASSSLAEAKPQTAGFSLTQYTQSHHYKVSLLCNDVLSVGSFQQCHLDILQKDTNKRLKNAKVSIGGGMPAHHHGLPTSPLVHWSATNNSYVIEGLKFSMPGEWELRFLIENKPGTQGKTFEEKVVFKFTL